MRSERTCMLRLGWQSGLTLVELLVAISVLGFVAVMGWRGLDSIIRAREVLTVELDQTRSMQLTFAQLQSDCVQIADSALIANRVPITFNQGSITLIRKVYADDQPTRLQVVSYRLLDGMLSRSESAATRDLRQLDTAWQSALNDGSAGIAVVLLRGIATVSMRLWIEGGTGWLDSSNVARVSSPVVSGVLPKMTGLELTMQMQERKISLKKIFLLGMA